MNAYHYIVIALWFALSLQDVSAVTWPDAMLEQRKEVVTNRRETKEASEKLDLDKLRCSPWHGFELAIFSETGQDAWPFSTKPVHEYDTPVDQAFKRDGLIDLKKKYLSAVNKKGKNAHNRFKKTDLRDGLFWASPNRFRNRITYYYKSIDVPQDRSIDIHLGFNEGCKVFRDIDVSWDGKRILFAWKKNRKKDDYHLYEMNWPGRKVRQLTFGLNGKKDTMVAFINSAPF